MSSLRSFQAAACLAMVACCATPASATVVLPNGSLTDLGLFQAGSYAISGSGAVDLVGGSPMLTINPDGTPTYPITSSNYPYFNPNGSYTADGSYGPAGANAKIGALIGTLLASPTVPADWFLIGYAATLTLANASHIYASVNDTYYPNNVGSFNAVVTALAVPEPAPLALVFAGLIALAVTRRAARRPGATPRP